MSHTLSAALLASTALWALLGASEARAFELEYREGPGVRRCPGARWLRREVEGLLAAPERTTGARLKILISSSERRLVAEITDHQGGLRRLSDPQRRCSALTSAAALAMAAALEPVGLTLELPPPAIGGFDASPGEGVVSGALSLPLSARVRTMPSPISWRVEAGGHLAAGVAPGTPLGVYGRLGLRQSPWGVHLDGRLMRSADAPASQGTLDTDGALGGAWGCRWWGAFRGCLGGVAGLLWLRGRGFVTNSDVVAPLLAAGGRIGASWPRAGRWGVDVWGEGLIAASSVRLRVDDEIVWESGPGSLGIGLGIFSRF